MTKSFRSSNATSEQAMTNEQYEELLDKMRRVQNELTKQVEDQDLKAEENKMKLQEVLARLEKKANKQVVLEN